MRNLDMIRMLPVDELADYLIDTDVVDSENYVYSHTSPSGKEFDTYKEAKEDCIKWLNEERK